MEDGRGQIMKEQTPAVVVAIVLFVCAILLLVLTVAYHKMENKKVSNQSDLNLKENELLLFSNKEKDEKITKLVFDTSRITILNRRLDSLQIVKDTAIANVFYWKTRHSLVKAVLRRERKNKKDSSLSVK